jgi:hypothetical protein
VRIARMATEIAGWAVEARASLEGLAARFDAFRRP